MFLFARRSVSVCTYACMHACMCVRRYVRMHVGIPTHMYTTHVHIDNCTCIYIHIITYIFLCVYIYVGMYVCIYKRCVCVFLCVCIYTQMKSYTRLRSCHASAGVSGRKWHISHYLEAHTMNPPNNLRLKSGLVCDLLPYIAHLQEAFPVDVHGDPHRAASLWRPHGRKSLHEL